MLGTREEAGRGKFLEDYKREKKKVKRCIYQSKKEVQEQFGRKMNQDANGNKKLFWKEVSIANEEKMESSNRIKDRKGRLGLEEVEVRRIWKEYFEDLYDIVTQEHVPVHFYGVRRGN